MREPFIFLCPEITRADALTLMQWLRDDEVIKYLSDTHDVSADIARVVNKVNLPVLTHLFNKDGRFYMAYDKNKKPVGFVRLIVKNAETEIVVVIGDRGNWGKGLGGGTILESLKIAFFELRSPRVVAKIHCENNRSVRAFLSSGFTLVNESASLKSFSMTMGEYLESVRERAAASVIYITELDRNRLYKLINDELNASADERAVKDLEFEISRARIVQPQQLDDGVVTMNSRALLSLNDVETEVALAYPDVSDWSEKHLSVLSPIGTAILGYSEGDDIRWDTPDGIAHIQIKKMLYQPEAAGHYHL